MSKYYCTVHNREATHQDSRGYPRCDMSLGGITMPCKTYSVDSVELALIKGAYSVDVYDNILYAEVGNEEYMKFTLERVPEVNIKGFVVEGLNE